MKHVIDKTRLAQSMQKTSVALIMLEISIWLTPLTKTSEFIRYVQQGTYAVTVILGVRALLSLRQLIPRSVRRAVFDKFLYAMRKMASNFAGISKKFLSLLGLKLDRFKRGKDEKSFIFGEDDDDYKRKKRHSIKSSAKWRDMEENSEKIRFLYIKYILKTIKGGYKYHSSLTPNEVCDDLGFEEDDQAPRLFDMYNGARYSGGSIFITDEQVELAQEIVAGKKK